MNNRNINQTKPSKKILILNRLIFEVNKKCGPLKLSDFGALLQPYSYTYS